MNILSEIFAGAYDGQIITLGKNQRYDVFPEDSFVNKGYFCSNSAKQDENPEGIRFSAIFLKDKKNVVIDGNGAEIIVHGKMTPILLYGCENITVKNLCIDYAVPTMTEFTVLDSSDGVITIRINDDCLWRVDDNKLYWHGEISADGSFYWENQCNAPKRYIKVLDPDTGFTHDFNRENLTFDSIEIIEHNVLKCTLNNKDVSVKAGEIFQTRNIIRDQVGSMCERCKNLTFENLRVRFMHGLGMVSQFCENVTFRSCDFTPKEKRTIASTADFFQFSGCKGKLIIENCRAFGAQDDYINVHGTHLRVVDADFSEKSLLMRFMHPETWGFQAYECDDKIDFIRWDTLQPYFKADVISWQKINNTDIKLYVSDIPQDLIIGKDVIENATCNPELYVKNCYFGPTSGRGILATTRGGVVIENNCFKKLWGPALLIEDDCNFWFESGYTENVIFRNNDVISCNFGNTCEGAPVIQYTPKVMNDEFDGYVHGKLIVSNNRFMKPVYGKHTFYLEYLNEAEFSHNEYDEATETIAYKCGKFLQNDNC